MSIVSYEGRGGEIMETESTLEVSTPGASYALVKATIDSQIATARMFPRNISRVIQEVTALAGITKGVASSCIYALPRSGKMIEGPSARFAEILQSCWGNIRVTGRVIEETDRYIVVMGECIDLQKNSGRQVELRVGITQKNGMKYNPDMVIMTANAAIAKATRNAVFQVVPRAFWESAFQAVREIIKGAMPIGEARESWIGYWKSKAIAPEHVYEQLGVICREDITDDHIVTMTGWNSALEAGETTLAELFPIKPAVSVKAQNLTDALGDIKAKTAAKADAKPVNKPAKEQDLEWEPGAGG